MENGRVVTGPYGYLVARVIHKKDIYKAYLGLDANMANLMRPGMYGAYHHITVLGKEDAPADHTYDVTGSLCENNDKFAIDRALPHAEIGDIVVIHDAGAHGHSMGFNYNGKLRSAELLMRPDGSVRMIRRAETVDDLFQTIEWEGVADESVEPRREARVG
jgi:diaminopimelate decarboxylase